MNGLYSYSLTCICYDCTVVLKLFELVVVHSSCVVWVDDISEKSPYILHQTNMCTSHMSFFGDNNTCMILQVQVAYTLMTSCDHYY